MESNMIGDYGNYVLKIGDLQRMELDMQNMRIPDQEIRAGLSTAFDLDKQLPVWLVEVQGISRTSSQKTALDQSKDYPTKDILAGLNGQNVPIYFLLWGRKQQVRIFIGTVEDSEGCNTAVRALFDSQFPGGKLWPEHELSEELSNELMENVEKQWKGARENLQEIREFLNGCSNIGVVTGIFTSNAGKSPTNRTQIDRLIQGLYGEEWAFLVMAEPVSDQTIIDLQLETLQERLRLEQEQGLHERRESAGSSTLSYYYELLQMQHQLYELCLYEGAWQVQSYICSPNQDTYRRGKALVKSVFSGDFARIDRIRVLDCPGAGKKVASFSPIMWEREARENFSSPKHITSIPKYHTLVASSQLSAAIHLPQEEMPGFFVRDIAAYDVSSHVPPKERTISLGEILDRGRPTNNSYRIKVSDLNKHCLVVGITGSGKTNTVFHLLTQLDSLDPSISFLVIEPAKREYRRLVRLLGDKTGLRVLTVGEEGPLSAPIRINPFEIPKGVPVQTHIDLLKSVFNASFGMWPPLPQVLERAIIEIYQEKGWDVVQGINRRADQRGKAERQPRSQPTLSDLFHKIGQLVPSLGYDQEVTRNVRTALETRINSLRMGAKGLMLDTHTSIPVQTLLDKPTVLELEGIGDDDEKAFVMGLLLVSLYEYYRSKGEPGDSDLHHVTVIEEAHRLLTNIPMQSGTEGGNPRAKAIETFVNMLSEVRAYGEGFVIAEQIPTKLAPDVIKNTAFKVMHRTVSTDDRSAMGGAMNLSDDQIRNIVALGTGQTVVHGGGDYGDDRAILVQVPYSKGDKKLDLSEQDIHAVWVDFTKKVGLEPAFSTYPTCSHLCQPRNLNCSSARSTSEQPRVAEAFTTLVTSLAGIGGSAEEDTIMLKASSLLQRVIDSIQAAVYGTPLEKKELRCILTHGVNRFLDHIGGMSGWSYEDIDRLASLLVTGIAGQVEGGREASFDKEKINAFINDYIACSGITVEPFYGCKQVCPPGSKKGRRLCLYRYPMAHYLFDPKVDADYLDAKYEPEALIDLAKMTSNRVLDLDQDSPPFEMASKCFLLQRIHRDNSLSVRAQRNLIDSILDYSMKEPMSASSGE